MGLGITKKQKAMVGVLLCGTFIAVLNATLLTPALPTIMRDLSVPATTVQWLTSGYALTEAVVIPLAAYLMGRFSTRQLYIGGITLFGLGSVLAAFSPIFPLLLAGRVMQAAATGAVMPMVMTTILLVFPRERRGSAMGIIGLLIGFAPAIGPSLSGLLIDFIGWRAIFVLVAVLSFIVVAVATATLENNENFKRTKFDLLSVVLSTVGLISLLYGLSTFSSAENHVITAVLVVVGLLLMGLYVFRQTRLEEPMLRVSILGVRQYRTVCIVIMIFMAALVGMETVMPLYIQGTLGKSATVSGIALLPGALIGAITGFFSGKLFDRFGVRLPALAGGIAIIAAGYGLGHLEASSDILLVTAIYTVLAIGMQFTMTPLNTWGVNSLANSDIQHAQSTSNTLNQVAGSFGTALLVSVSATVAGMTSGVSEADQTFAGYHAAFTTTGCLVCVAVLIISFFVRDKKKSTASDVARGASAKDARASEAEISGNVADGSGSAAALNVLSKATVEDAMNKQAVTVLDTDNMARVVTIMATTDTSGVSVVDSDGKLVGYITDGDVAKYLARKDVSLFSPQGNIFTYFADDDSFNDRLDDLAKLNVMELATLNVITLDMHAPLEVACALFSERRIKKAPVVEDGVLKGALSRRNVMHYMLNETTACQSVDSAKLGASDGTTPSASDGASS